MSSRRATEVLVVLALLIACACAATQGAQDQSDPSGLWFGDFGPAFYDRNTISLELQWDGKELTGKVRPGVPGGRMYRNFESFPIQNASFNPTSGAIKFEALFQPRGRRYFIEGKVSGNTLSGTWSRPDENKDGDFKLTRQKAPAA